MGNNGSKKRCGCMDFRNISGNFDYRNAGGSFDGFGNEVIDDFRGDKGLKELNIIVHRDCGGLKFIAAVLEGNWPAGISPRTRRLMTPFISHFMGQGFEGASSDKVKMAKMEEFNRSLQERLAMEALEAIGRSDVKVNVQLVGFPLDQHADRVTVVIGRLDMPEAEVAKLAGSELGSTYIIRGVTLDEVEPSLEIARLVMEKKDIVLIAATKDDVDNAKELASRPFMEGIEPRIVEAAKARRKIAG